MILPETFHEELTIAGHGGQGIILLGKLLAHTAMRNAMEVTYMPAYGAEVRGGAASCSVAMSSEPIASPLVAHPDSLITMNATSFEQFVHRLKSGGLIVINSSQIDRRPDRDDVAVLALPADEIAVELANPRSANMVMLGAYLQCKQLLDAHAVVASLPHILAQRYHHTLPVNEQALLRGVEFAHTLSVNRV